jgi:cytoskeletal protein RodZ
VLTPGQILSKKRQELRLELSLVSQETRISEKYLEAIEKDDYSIFDSQVYASGFVKLYAKYLDLDEEKLLALFRRLYKQGGSPKVGSKRLTLESFTKYLNPKNIGIFTALVVFSAILIFVNLQFYNFQNTPTLEINTPNDNSTSEVKEITIEGKTSSNTELLIEEKKVKIGSAGNFSLKYTLKEGENSIEIIAINRSNREKKAVETLDIRYSPKIEVIKEEDVVKKDVNVQVKITEESAWVQLVVDGQQKLAQIISGTTEEYLAIESIEIISGRPTITQLLINGEVKELSINPETGVASLSCTIKDGTTSCE